MPSSVARKPAPPIPKKPTLLTKSSDRQASNESKILGKDEAKSSRLPAGQERAATRDSRVDLPPRTTGAEAMASQSDEHHQQSPSNVALPPRRSRAAARNPSGLMDEDDEGASSIPSLQPIRRT